MFVTWMRITRTKQNSFSISIIKPRHKQHDELHNQQNLKEGTCVYTGKARDTNKTVTNLIKHARSHFPFLPSFLSILTPYAHDSKQASLSARIIISRLFLWQLWIAMVSTCCLIRVAVFPARKGEQSRSAYASIRFLEKGWPTIFLAVRPYLASSFLYFSLRLYFSLAFVVVAPPCQHQMEQKHLWQVILAKIKLFLYHILILNTPFYFRQWRRRDLKRAYLSNIFDPRSPQLVSNRGKAVSDHRKLCAAYALQYECADA